MVSVKEVPQIGDRIYTDFRECCEDQKVSYRWVCNKMLQEGVSVQDAVRYYKRKQEKKLQKAQKQVPVKGKMLEPQPVNVLGKKYESKERCYKGLGITKKSVQNHMKKLSYIAMRKSWKNNLNFAEKSIKATMPAALRIILHRNMLR